MAGGAPAEPVPTLFASGGAMLVDRATFLEAGGFDEDYFGYGYPAVWLEYAQSRYNYGYYYYYPLIYGVTVDTTNHTASWYYGYYEYPYGRGLYETYWLAGEVTFSY